MKKAVREWEQKYYEEKSKSIKILKNPSFKVIDESGSFHVQPSLTLKSQAYRGKEKVIDPIKEQRKEWCEKLKRPVVADGMEVESDSFETDQLIHFGTIPTKVSSNMVYTLPMAFMAKPN